MASSKYVAALFLGAWGVCANAATYSITGGDWTDIRVWNTSEIGTSDIRTIYDNGSAPREAVFYGESGSIDWMPITPPVQSGSYSGRITTDASGLVIDGYINVLGNIGYEQYVSNNSWWFVEYIDLTIDFTSGVANSTVNCYETILAPANCSVLLGSENFGAEDMWTPVAGNESSVGPFHEAAIFDGLTLEIWHESFNGTIGHDYLNTLTLEAQVVPIPAAAWLFGSVLGLLGWIRRYKS